MQMMRLKRCTKIIAGQSPDGETVSPLSDELPFLQGCAEFGEVSPVPKKSCSEPPKVAPENAWLFSVRAPVGALNLADRDYGIGRGLAAVLPTSIDHSYLGYALVHVREYLRSLATGSTFEAISTPQLGNAEIPLPDLDTQRRIADYLDDKTARIDALIEKKRALLDRLAEKRQALITRAVTRGLNPSAPLKGSGIDWLGKVPAHWEVWPLKRYLTESQYGISEALSEADEVAILRMSNIQNLGIDLTELKFVDEVAPFLLLQENDVLFNRTNSIDLVGKSAIYKGTYEGALSFASYLARFRFDGRYLPEFANFVFGTEQLLEYARTMAFRAIGQANLNPTRFAEIAVPVPPVDEQKAIIEFLTPHGEQTEAVTSKITASIERLTEYRAALVTAAVTGKIKALLTIPTPAALMEEA